MDKHRIDPHAKERALFEEWARKRGFDLTPRVVEDSLMGYRDGRTRDRWSGWLFSGSYRPPVDMVLHCPGCGLQHIDAPEPRFTDNGEDDTVWTNPPHRSHLCHGCGHIWRPADVCTNGVEAVATVGKNDSPIAVPAGGA